MKQEFIEDIVALTKKDFDNRSTERRQFEAQWQLNSNFVMGNQFCTINVKGEVEDCERDYFWQEREVYNHIAAIMESRLAKLGRVRPSMSVRPASGDDDDIKTGKASSKILSSACNKLELDALLSTGTMWSELTGSVFYKVSWDEKAGRVVGFDDAGKEITEGDTRIDVCPPYEIYPDNLTATSIDELNSIIHAKAVHVDDIKRIWGKNVEAEEIMVNNLSSVGMVGGLGITSAVATTNKQTKSDHAVVIERYSMPTVDKPEGELIIVAGKELLYYGVLPYINGLDGRKVLPFIKQDSITRAGCFFGVSMVERTIPIQRAYNAVKNRKHEFMNRLSMGILAVEDGSVDTDNLEDEGLSPGKILVYRQGSNPPVMLDMGRVPTDFSYEEDRLLNEFITVSGVSEIMRSSRTPSSMMSGVALQMLIEQDDTRLSVTAESIRQATRKMAQHLLRLYKQFASETRLTRFVGSDGEVELLAWKGSDISCDDVIFDTENEMNMTPAIKQNMMFELIKLGLLHDENGKLSDSTRYKVLENLGYGGWEMTKDVELMQHSRAIKENMRMEKEKVEVNDIDDHEAHISEHIRFMLSADYERLVKRKPSIKERMAEHLRLHRQVAKIMGESENNGTIES